MLEKNVKLDNSTVLVTGAAGFIGANLILALMKNVQNIHVIGIDNMNDYYDVALKEFRLRQIEDCSKNVSGRFTFIRESIADKMLVSELFAQYQPQIVVNLAAQAGVRYSIENPDAYIGLCTTHSSLHRLAASCIPNRSIALITRSLICVGVCICH